MYVVLGFEGLELVSKRNCFVKKELFVGPCHYPTDKNITFSKPPSNAINWKGM